MEKILLTFVILGVLTLSTIGVLHQVNKPKQLPPPTKPAPLEVEVLHTTTDKEIPLSLTERPLSEGVDNNSSPLGFRIEILALFNAIAKKESNFNDEAVGKNGELGRYQIKKAYWIDGCKELGVSWDYETMVKDPAKCEQVMLGYWIHYKAVTNELRARIHHCGPSNIQSLEGLYYWMDIQRIMKGN